MAPTQEPVTVAPVAQAQEPTVWPQTAPMTPRDDLAAQIPTTTMLNKVSLAPMTKTLPDMTIYQIGTKPRSLTPQSPPQCGVDDSSQPTTPALPTKNAPDTVSPQPMAQPDSTKTKTKTAQIMPDKVKNKRFTNDSSQLTLDTTADA